MDVEEQKKEELSLKNMDMYHKIKTDSSKEVSRIILLIDTGAFGVSIPFLSALNGNIIWPACLLCSWIAILISLYFMMEHHDLISDASLRSQHLINAYRAERGRPNEKLATLIDENMNIKDPDVKQMEYEAKSKRRSARTLLMIGIGFLLIFAAANLLQRSDRSDCFPYYHE